MVGSKVAGVKKVTGSRSACRTRRSSSSPITPCCGPMLVVPVNLMNKAAELTHYITDPVARVAIVSSDLAAAWIATPIRRSPPPKPDMALQRLLVTRYCDEMSNGALPAGGFPDAWRAWLDLAVDMPTYATAWATRWAAGLTASAHRRPGRSGCAALHLWHHRAAQGLHAPTAPSCITW